MKERKKGKEKERKELASYEKGIEWKGRKQKEGKGRKRRKEKE